jgi:hypothetical protein
VRLIAWLGWLLVGACGMGQGASYILLDDQARAAGVEVEVDGLPHGGALPLEVEAGGRVEVRGGTARASVAVEGGRLYHVRGAQAVVVEWALGQQVQIDLAQVAGPPVALQMLASALGARKEGAGDRFRLQGPDVFVRLAWLGDRPEITAVEPVLAPDAIEETRLGNAPGFVERFLLPAARPREAAGRGDPTLAPLVGLYTGGAGESIFLDAGGTFRWHSGCDVLQGRYQLAGGQVRLEAGPVLQVTGEGTLQASDRVFTVRGDQ